MSEIFLAFIFAELINPFNEFVSRLWEHQTIMFNTATKGAIAAVALAGLVLIGYNLVLIGVKSRKKKKKEDSTERSEQEKEVKKEALEVVKLERTTVDRIEFRETRDSASRTYTGNVWNVVISNAFSNAPLSPKDSRTNAAAAG
jgi:hypothetical protein